MWLSKLITRWQKISRLLIRKILKYQSAVFSASWTMWNIKIEIEHISMKYLH
ncbi:hypothetical protein bcgnr5378_09190 [Bacillus cereus]